MKSVFTDLRSRVLGYFNSRKKYIPAFHIKNLIQMANVDGEYHQSEDFFLRSVVEQTNISEEKIREIKNNLSGIVFDRPENRDVRFTQLFNFIEMMLADGRIRKEEFLFCQQLAELLDFRKDIAQRLVEAIQYNIISGYDIDETKSRVHNLVKFNN